ncbi:hypothetical protein COO60DRAFT_1703383 [Scenedesmus sp. NREL 46B-D3]|nr:hypothetical protein COO60DRAFT_1703383 [Scenedesmus sp. NREL 46B-D3]
MRCLAQQGFQPAVWWLVHLLAVSHARVTHFDAPAASGMLWAAAQLSQRSQLPSDKWCADFAGQFWSQLAGVSVEQLVEGVWGAVKVGYRPTDQQWASWDAAAAAVGWELTLQQARDAVEAMRAAQRRVPEPLLQQLQREFDQRKAARAAEVAAAEAARQQAAAALAAQQQRAAAAAAAIAAHRTAAAAGRPQQQQQQLSAASEFVADMAKQGTVAAVGNSKGRRRRALMAAARGSRGPVLVLQSLGAASSGASGGGDFGGAGQARAAMA